ncbi:MAG: hypothetical protein WAM30_16970, partial [Candidatus Dormiibacterota bacterium]
MASQCMPGMSMPGCPSPAPAASPSSGAALSGTHVVLVLIVALSLFVLFAFTWRAVQRARIPGYRWASDWLGHGVHAPGMIAMSLLMLGVVPSIGPPWAYEAGYGALALVFLGLALTARGRLRPSRDGWHLFLHLSMVYMFARLELLPLTVVFLALYVLFIVYYGWQSA